MTTEKVNYSTYHLMETSPSKLGLQEKITVSIGFTCPRCDTAMRPIDHGEIHRCPKCDLWFQLWGNALCCSDVKPTTAYRDSPEKSWMNRALSRLRA